jgi:sugar-specific transcriptional regulator TrmB
VKLLQTGPSRASTLASLADLNRTKMYRVLDDLVEDRYASASVGRPTIYRAQEPERVFELLRKDLAARERTLERVEDDVLEPLRSLAGEEHEVSDPDWKLVEGYPRIYETLNRCLRDVEDEIVLVSNHAITTNMVPFVEEAWETAVDRAQEGVTFRAMLDLDRVQGDRVQEWSQAPNVHVRDVRIDDPLHFVLLDDQLNLTFRSPLTGPVRPGEPRFPDMSAPYDPELQETALAVARERGAVWGPAAGGASPAPVPVVPGSFGPSPVGAPLPAAARAWAS